jgi:Xaa-Pro aminopeptidase
MYCRGSDIPYNPVTIAYAVVTPTAAHLFIDSSKLTAEVTQHLHAVELHSYGDIEAFLVDAAASCIVWADLSQLSWALALSLPASALKHNPSLIALPKSIKNAAELQGIREAHVRDGAALTAFLCWLDAAVRSGEAVTELDVTVKIGNPVTPAADDEQAPIQIVMYVLYVLYV